MLANRTEHGTTSEVAAEVTARIREGRTDAADATYNSRESQAKAWKPRDERSVPSEDMAGQDPAADAPTEKDSSERTSSREGAEGNLDQGGGQPHSHGGSPEPETQGQATDAVTEPDPSDVQGQAAPSSAPLAAAGPIGQSVVQGSAGAAPVAAPIAMATVAASAAGKAAGARAQTSQPAQSILPQAAAKDAKKAQAAAPPKPALPTEQAREILDQVRIKILDGKREARIQLRPIELGRLDLLIRVDGSFVTAKLAAETPEALSVLESHAPELRAWLARDGAESVDLQLSLLDPENPDFAHAKEDSGTHLGDRGDSPANAGRRSAADTTSTPADSAALLSSISRRVAEGGVDFVA